MKFERSDVAGGWVDQDRTGMTPDLLIDCVSKRLRSHPRIAAFLAAAANVGVTVREIAREPGATSTPGGNREVLEEVAQAAHRMQAALFPLADASDAFELLASHSDYVLLRARSGGPAQGRPVVPEVPSGTPDVPDLLARIHSDLAALRTLCDYAAEKVKPQRNPEKGAERLLVQLLADAHREFFSAEPPQRGWFADLAQYIGAAIGLDVGHTVVRSVVTSGERPDTA